MISYVDDQFRICNSFG